MGLLLPLCDQVLLGIYFWKKYLCFTLLFALSMCLLAHFLYNKLLCIQSGPCFKNMPGMQLAESQFHTKACLYLNVVFLHYSKWNSYPEATFIIWKFSSVLEKHKSYFRLLHKIKCTILKEDKTMSMLLSDSAYVHLDIHYNAIFWMKSLLIFVLHKLSLKIRNTVVRLKTEELYVRNIIRFLIYLYF